MTANTTPSPAAFIRQYRYDVTHDLQEAETALLIWRNAEDDVMYQTLDGFDMMLLEIMGSSALSFDTLAQTLVEFMPKADNWKNILLGNGQAGLNKGLSSLLVRHIRNMEGNSPSQNHLSA
ncbi:hypothetical protein F9Z36_1761 [Neisseria gonorrhoeae]|nr:hypothetical protein F9Z36_1761 [Neisseria gonorrhoeae]